MKKLCWNWNSDCHTNNCYASRHYTETNFTELLSTCEACKNLRFSIHFLIIYVSINWASSLQLCLSVAGIRNCIFKRYCQFRNRTRMSGECKCYFPSRENRNDIWTFWFQSPQDFSILLSCSCFPEGRLSYKWGKKICHIKFD